METEALLDALAADTLVPWKLERSIQLALIVGNIIAGMMFLGGIGFRPDIVFAMGTTRFLVKFAVTLPLALTATAAMLRVARPGAAFGIRGWALALSPTILMSAVLVELTKVPSALWGSTIMGTHAKKLLNSDTASIDWTSGLHSSCATERSLDATGLGRSDRRACRERHCGDILRNELHG
jgi:hypothetical protein